MRSIALLTAAVVLLLAPGFDRLAGVLLSFALVGMAAEWVRSL